MIRKTFTDKLEAYHYQDGLLKQGAVVVLGSLGDKFRVYAETKAEIESRKEYLSNYTPQRAQHELWDKAYQTKQEVGDALAVKKSMESGELYNDYEATIEAARIMERIGELKTAKDVFTFIDQTSKYEKVMTDFIQDTLEEYDYEGKEDTVEAQNTTSQTDKL